MKSVDKKALNKPDGDSIKVRMDPPGKIGHTQKLFISIHPEPLDMPAGVMRFKTHEEMDRHMEEAIARSIAKSKLRKQRRKLK